MTQVWSRDGATGSPCGILVVRVTVRRRCLGIERVNRKRCPTDKLAFGAVNFFQEAQNAGDKRYPISPCVGLDAVA